MHELCISSQNNIALLSGTFQKQVKDYSIESVYWIDYE